MERMGQVRILLCLLAVAALAAGCGSSKPKPASGEVSKPASQILKDAQRAASTARSVHVVGHGSQQGQTIGLDLSISLYNGASGSFRLFGGSVTVLRIGPHLYIRGDSAFWRHFGSNPRLAGRWVVVPSSASAFQGLTGLMSMSGISSKLAIPGKITKEGVRTFRGQKVIVLRDPSEKGTFYVAATGRPYPVALVGGTSSVEITFDHWNKPVTVPSPPKHAVSVLGG
jgi:hypothetical protein